MWPARAAEVAQTVTAFPRSKAEKAVKLLYGADCDLKGTHIDDRTTFEMLILEMTA